MTGKGSRRRLKTYRLYAAIVSRKQEQPILRRFSSQLQQSSDLAGFTVFGQAELAFCSVWAQEQISTVEAKWHGNQITISNAKSVSA